MNSDQVYQVIEQIKAESSKTGKQAIIKAYGEDVTFRRVLEAALDPRITYGIAKRPEILGASEGLTFGADTWVILDMLANRSLTGNAARDAVFNTMTALSSESAELFWRIIAKDLRADFSASTVNKAIPGLIVTFDCMLAEPFKDHHDGLLYPAYWQLKLDGVRVLAFVDPAKPIESSVQFFSRTGKEFTTFDHLKPELVKMLQQQGVTVPVVFDGEVVSGKFNETVSAVRKKDVAATDAIFYVFDTLTVEEFKTPGKDGVGDPYHQRADELAWLVEELRSPLIQSLPLEIVTCKADVDRKFAEAIAAGFEGGIVKNMNAQYHRRRNKAWLKVKAEETVDVQIIGAYEGKEGKGLEGEFGGWLVDFNGVVVRVGGGFGAAQRVEALAAARHDAQVLGLKWSPGVVINDGPIKEPAVYVAGPLTDPRLQAFGRTIEVQYHEVTPDGSLRHPRYKRFRDDKPLKEAA